MDLREEDFYSNDLKDQLDYLTPDSRLNTEKEHSLNSIKLQGHHLVNYESVISQNIENFDLELLHSNLKKQGKNISLDDLQNMYCYTMSV
jgi:hypothetical protein